MDEKKGAWLRPGATWARNDTDQAERVLTVQRDSDASQDSTDEAS